MHFDVPAWIVTVFTAIAIVVAGFVGYLIGWNRCKKHLFDDHLAQGTDRPILGGLLDTLDQGARALRISLGEGVKIRAILSKEDTVKFIRELNCGMNAIPDEHVDKVYYRCGYIIDLRFSGRVDTSVFQSSRNIISVYDAAHNWSNYTHAAD